MSEKSDYEKPFPERYLHAADAMTRLEHWLAVVGMGGNDSFARLKTDFIRHGGETLNDMQRHAPPPAAKPRTMGL